MKKNHRETIRCARKIGIADARIIQNDPHSFLVGTYKGTPIRMTISNGSRKFAVDYTEQYVRQQANRAYRGYR